MSVRHGCTRAPPRRHFSTMHLVAKNGNLLFHFLWIKSIFKNIFVVLLYKKNYLKLVLVQLNKVSIMFCRNCSRLNQRFAFYPRKRFVLVREQRFVQSVKTFRLISENVSFSQRKRFVQSVKTFVQSVKTFHLIRENVSFNPKIHLF